MTDFETHPVGTGKRLEELTKALEHIESGTARDEDGEAIGSLSGDACGDIATRALLGAVFLTDRRYSSIKISCDRCGKGHVAVCPTRRQEIAFDKRDKWMKNHRCVDDLPRL